MTRLTGDKPENCGVLSQHSNNKTNILPTFQVHDFLTGTLLLHKNVAKNVKARVFIIKIIKRKNVFASVNTGTRTEMLITAKPRRLLKIMK